MNPELESSSSEIPTGIVPRKQLPTRMVPLKIVPVIQENEAPFYVKLRAEVDRAFLNSGAGKLYLGFHLDPIYAVHWNNLTKPLEFELSLSSEVEVTPKRESGPTVNEVADKDPRYFLLNLSAANFNEPIALMVRYFACDDANIFCVSGTQNYSIYLQEDPDGGSAHRGSRSRAFLNRLRKRVRDQDGKFSLDEVPEPFQARLRFVDTNGDGLIDEEELWAMVQ